MESRSRVKGARLDRELAAALESVRLPLAGAVGGEYAGDVKALGLTWEAKGRANGFRQLYAWLEGADALAVRADRREWLAVMPLATLRRLAALATKPTGRPRRDVPVARLCDAYRRRRSVRGAAREVGIPAGTAWDRLAEAGLVGHGANKDGAGS